MLSTLVRAKKIFHLKINANEFYFYVINNYLSFYFCVKEKIKKAQYHSFCFIALKQKLIEFFWTCNFMQKLVLMNGQIKYV